MAKYISLMTSTRQVYFHGSRSTPPDIGGGNMSTRRPRPGQLRTSAEDGDVREGLNDQLHRSVTIVWYAIVAACVERAHRRGSHAFPDDCCSARDPDDHSGVCGGSTCSDPAADDHERR